VQVATAQESKKDKQQQKLAAIESLMTSKDFAFVAQSALPMAGRNINLTTIYGVRWSADTVVADLPYFGRAFVAPINPAEGGIRFTSTKFSYTISPKRKGGWDITVLPQDTRDVRQMFLSVSEEGYATLQVTSNNRQSISFRGYVTDRAKLR
jgi:hypothetical protein